MLIVYLYQPLTSTKYAFCPAWSVQIVALFGKYSKPHGMGNSTCVKMFNVSLWA